MLFEKRKKPPAADYDRGEKIPVIRSSICTGEQVAGFRDPVSGRFEELMLIRDGGPIVRRLKRSYNSFSTALTISGRRGGNQTGVVRADVSSGIVLRRLQYVWL